MINPRREATGFCAQSQAGEAASAVAGTELRIGARPGVLTRYQPERGQARREVDRDMNDRAVAPEMHVWPDDDLRRTPEATGSQDQGVGPLAGRRRSDRRHGSADASQTKGRTRPHRPPAGAANCRCRHVSLATSMGPLVPRLVLATRMGPSRCQSWDHLWRPWPRPVTDKRRRWTAIVACAVPAGRSTSSWRSLLGRSALVTR
jgi:hypothetical protein